MPLAPTHPNYQAARVRSLAAISAKSRQTAEAARAVKRTRMEALEAELRRIVSLAYPAGIVPAADTWFWRELASATGSTEAELTRIGAKAGVWPWSAREVRQ